MQIDKVLHALECSPVIAAVQQEALPEALASPAEVIFHLGADLMHIPAIVQAVHETEPPSNIWRNGAWMGSFPQGPS